MNLKRLKRLWITLAAACFVASMAASAIAAPITFASGNGDDSVTPGAVTVVTPHPVWGDVNSAAGLAPGTAKWIANGPYGYGQSVAPNWFDANSNGIRDIGEQTALFAISFFISGPGDFDVHILADDTATVVLTGPGGYSNQLFTAVNVQVDPCAGGGTGLPIGCVNADMGNVSLTGLSVGWYTMWTYAFQTNFVTFGVQYAGHYSQDTPPPPTVPEPTSLVLFGTGLIGFATRMRRRIFGKNSEAAA